MSDQYTQGTWRYTIAVEGATSVWSGEQLIAAIHRKHAAAARRIVACVNACGHIPTELLETEYQGGKLYDALADFNQKVFELRNQRDELLRAAVAAMTIVNRDNPDGSIAHDLRAAIAKAEGRKSPEQKQYTQREVFNAARENEIPLCVMNIAGSAADNAAATINENGGQFVQGNFTDEFISIWYMTVIGLLSEGDCEPEASEWFASIGVRA